MKKSEKKLLEKINGLEVEKKPLDLSKINIEPTNEVKEKKNLNFNFIIPLIISCLLVVVCMSINLNETGPKEELPDKPGYSNPSVPSNPSEVSSLSDYFNQYYHSDDSYDNLSLETKVSQELIKIYTMATKEDVENVISKDQCKLFMQLLKESVENETISVDSLNLNNDFLGDGNVPSAPSVGPNVSQKPDAQINLYELMVKEIDEYLK